MKIDVQLYWLKNHITAACLLVALMIRLAYLGSRPNIRSSSTKCQCITKAHHLGQSLRRRRWNDRNQSSNNFEKCCRVDRLSQYNNTSLFRSRKTDCPRHGPDGFALELTVDHIFFQNQNVTIDGFWLIMSASKCKKLASIVIACNMIIQFVIWVLSKLFCLSNENYPNLKNYISEIYSRQRFVPKSTLSNLRCSKKFLNMFYCSFCCGSRFNFQP